MGEVKICAWFSALGGYMARYGDAWMHGRLVASWFLVRGYVVVVDASGHGRMQFWGILVAFLVAAKVVARVVAASCLRW